MGLTGMLHGRRGPAEIVLVRHGESAGNLADSAARDADAERLDLPARDADVELSSNGVEQGRTLGRWVGGLAPAARPDLVVSSPYRRAADTARAALGELDVDLLLDERLRERDLGLLDGLTGKGIRARHPEEAERRSYVGKFYYQPPSGESWADVVLRVRSLLADLREGYDGQRVWLFTHQAVIMSFRYALEGIEEAELLEIDRTTQIPNASVTRYRRRDSGLVLDTFADDGHLEPGPAERTAEDDRGGEASDG
ncbi:broad specificity phosphatase PhoE [Nocardioides cavernae]|uniref:phosphoglycerate mutase (2,3-diphosphoglycerate-dependent) n=1 Tax=Nocardioides cavernae TaxID=1921566 RepID=A0A7Y9H5P3_9ACTN|nr:histidine phosphatase family protein [Nocardioides cavernae]NYE38375.1 broad specificity phosphatase PhoE [Nocardioides cavernae]